MFTNLFARIRYITLLLVLVLAYIFYRSYFLLLFIIFLLVFPVISIILLSRTKRNIDIKLEAPVQVSKNADVTVNIKLSNTSYIPVIQSHIELVCSNDFYTEAPLYHFACGIPARNSAVISFTLKAEYCGNISLKIKSLNLWDFSGLADVSIPCSCSKDILVIPAEQTSELSLNSVGGAGLVELSEQEVKGNDSSMVIDTRDYRPGDKLQRIHWKLSTKLDKLLVKEYGSMSSEDILIILELSHGPFNSSAKDTEGIMNRRCFDAVFDAFSTISCTLLQEKRPYMAGWFSPAAKELRFFPITSREEFIEVLSLLYYEKPSDTLTDTVNIARSVMDDYGGFLYISPAKPAMFSKAGAEIIYSQTDADGQLLATVSIV